MAGGAAESGRSVTSKVTAILMAFSRGDAYSLTELAHLTGLPVSTAHRLAGELAARRLLERTEDGGYRIGLPLRMIGAGAAAARPVTSDAEMTGCRPDDAAAALSGAPSAHATLLSRAGAVMRDLALATRSPVRLGTIDGRVVLEVTVRPGDPAPVALAASARPAQDHALGRVLLAFSPSPVVDAMIGGAYPERLRRSLGTIRLTRFVVSQPGAAPGAVAMPVFGAGGALLAALELEVADMPDGLHGARAALAVATGSLSRQLATTHPAEATAV
jgi:DNA-binding IclR family transcriptional regulator